MFKGSRHPYQSANYHPASGKKEGWPIEKKMSHGLLLSAGMQRPEQWLGCKLGFHQAG